MPPIYPDLAWYSAISERRHFAGRCPHATVQRCPRYFNSLALLSDAKIVNQMPKVIYESAEAKWRMHDLAPATSETDSSISGADGDLSALSNFCPEVAFDAFRLFASTLIRLSTDPVDREIAEQFIREDPSLDGQDWRWSWGHIEPLHYSDCPLYSKLPGEGHVSQINFNAPVSGNVNVAGHSINSPAMNLSLAEILTKIEASGATPPEKDAAKSKLSAFLEHPVVAAVIGGLAGHVGG